MLSTKRISKELILLKTNPVPGIEIQSADNDISHWDCSIKGVGVYKGAIFKVSLDFPIEFPFKPVIVKFITQIYHPNVDKNGAICIAILKVDAWKPDTKIRAVLLGIVQMLEEPNPDDPLDTDIAQMYMTDRKKFDELAKQMVIKYAQ